MALKDGQVLFEHYQYERKPEHRFTSFSMAKTVVGMAIGIAVAEGHIKSIDDPVERYEPALADSAWKGVSVRHVLNMASGVRFDETYERSDSDIAKLSRPWTRHEGEFVDMLKTFHERDTAPGERFKYISADTQVLGAGAGARHRAHGGASTSARRSGRRWVPRTTACGCSNGGGRGGVLLPVGTPARLGALRPVAARARPAQWRQASFRATGSTRRPTCARPMRHLRPAPPPATSATATRPGSFPSIWASRCSASAARRSTCTRAQAGAGADRGVAAGERSRAGAPARQLLARAGARCRRALTLRAPCRRAERPHIRSAAPARTGRARLILLADARGVAMRTMRCISKRRGVEDEQRTRTRATGRCRRTRRRVGGGPAARGARAAPAWCGATAWRWRTPRRCGAPAAWRWCCPTASRSMARVRGIDPATDLAVVSFASAARAAPVARDGDAAASVRVGDVGVRRRPRAVGPSCRRASATSAWWPGHGAPGAAATSIA